MVTVDGAPVFTSGRSWVGAQSAIVTDHFYNGETVDGARAAAEAGWSAPSFNPAGWMSAKLLPSPTAALSAHTMPAIAGWEAPLSPTSVAPIPGRPGAYVFDLVNNSAGHCTATLPGPTPAGVSVVLTMAEVSVCSPSPDHPLAHHRYPTLDAPTRRFTTPPAATCGCSFRALVPAAWMGATARIKPLRT